MLRVAPDNVLTLERAFVQDFRVGHVTPVGDREEHQIANQADGFKIPPRSTSVNDLGLAKPIDRFGESIVIGIANAFH
jgi:hypothetical protein